MKPKSKVKMAPVHGPIQIQGTLWWSHQPFIKSHMHESVILSRVGLISSYEGIPAGWKIVICNSKSNLQRRIFPCNIWFISPSICTYEVCYTYGVQDIESLRSRTRECGVNSPAAMFWQPCHSGWWKDFIHCKYWQGCCLWCRSSNFIASTPYYSIVTRSSDNIRNGSGRGRLRIVLRTIVNMSPPQ